MATIKINYGGTTYSMVKTSSKITTPSVAVDGGWIPCFQGDRFAEVVSGANIYTLSPLMVNGYRLACGSRIAFNGTVYIHFPYQIHFVGGGSASEWRLDFYTNHVRASTSTTGYTCILTNQYWRPDTFIRNGSFSSGFPMQVTTGLFTASYTVRDSNNVAVKTGNILNRNFVIDCAGQQPGDYEYKVAV